MSTGTKRPHGQDFRGPEAWGIRNKATGKWCENCDFPTREEADAHLKAQYHREWIDQYEVARKDTTA